LDRDTSLWSSVELNSKSKVRVRSTRVGSEVDGEGKDLESVDEQETVQISGDWGSEVGLENSSWCLRREGLTIDEGDWHSGWCWLNCADEGVCGSSNEGITDVTWNIGQIVIIGSADKASSVELGNLTSSANQQVEGVEIITALPHSIVEFNSLSLGTVQISESVFVGLGLAIEGSSIGNEDVSLSASL